MKKTPQTVNTVAPLANVSLCRALLERAINRPPGLPGMVVLAGPSGFGKSIAAGHIGARYDACYVQCKSTFTKKALLTEILIELGQQPRKTIYDMYNQICEHLINRVLIIDEMDHIVDRKLVELIRDIYEGTYSPILLVGEEKLPLKLQDNERFHGRILKFEKALPVSIDDVIHLATLYCPSIDIHEDLLLRIHALAKGSVRRVCVNLARVWEEAHIAGWDHVGLAEWGRRELYTGNAPEIRRFK